MTHDIGSRTFVLIMSHVSLDRLTSYKTVSSRPGNCAAAPHPIRDRGQNMCCGKRMGPSNAVPRPTPWFALKDGDGPVRSRKAPRKDNAVVKNLGTKQRVQRTLRDCWQWDGSLRNKNPNGRMRMGPTMEFPEMFQLRRCLASKFGVERKGKEK